MKHDAASIDRALAAAVGPDAALFAELRAVFLESTSRQSLDLACALTDVDWKHAAWRLKGTAASFGAIGLMAAADNAAAASPHDPSAIAAVARAVEELLA